jgi:hypothetical protein
MVFYQWKIGGFSRQSYQFLLTHSLSVLSHNFVVYVAFCSINALRTDCEIRLER